MVFGSLLDLTSFWKPRDHSGGPPGNGGQAGQGNQSREGGVRPQSFKVVLGLAERMWRLIEANCCANGPATNTAWFCTLRHSGSSGVLPLISHSPSMWELSALS